MPVETYTELIYQNVPHFELWDRICQHMCRKWTIHHREGMTDEGKACLVIEKSNPIKACEDVYSLVENCFNDTIANTPTVAIYVYCACDPSCTARLKVVHYHLGRCNIYSNGKQHPAGSVADSANNPFHPLAKRIVKENAGICSAKQILLLIRAKGVERNVLPSDGRFKSSLPSISSKLQYFKNKNKPRNRSIGVQVTIQSYGVRILKELSPFDPSNFCIFLKSDTVLDAYGALNNFGYLLIDAWFKSTKFNISFTPVLTVNNYGKGVCLGIGVASNQTKVQIAKVVDMLYKCLQEKTNNQKPISNVMIDGCDATASVLEERHIDFTFCRFHILKAIGNHLPRDNDVWVWLTRLNPFSKTYLVI